MKIGRTMKREIYGSTTSNIGNPMYNIFYDYTSGDYTSVIVRPMINLITTPLNNLTNHRL
jgi:hypothetical protein